MRREQAKGRRGQARTGVSMEPRAQGHICSCIQMHALVLDPHACTVTIRIGVDASGRASSRRNASATWITSLDSTASAQDRQRRHSEHKMRFLHSAPVEPPAEGRRHGRAIYAPGPHARAATQCRCPTPPAPSPYTPSSPGPAPPRPAWRRSTCTPDSRSETTGTAGTASTTTAARAPR